MNPDESMEDTKHGFKTLTSLLEHWVEVDLPVVYSWDEIYSCSFILLQKSSS